MSEAVSKHGVQDDETMGRWDDKVSRISPDRQRCHQRRRRNNSSPRQVSVPDVSPALTLWLWRWREERGVMAEEPERSSVRSSEFSRIFNVSGGPRYYGSIPYIFKSGTT